MVGEGIDMVMGAVDKGEEILWTTTDLLEVESMIAIKISGVEASMVVDGSDDEDTKAFSGTDDVDREKEGMCSGILGT